MPIKTQAQIAAEILINVSDPLLKQNTAFKVRSVLDDLNDTNFGLLAAYQGTTNVNTLGTITTGIWHGNPIDNVYLANSSISGVQLGLNLNSLDTGKGLQIDTTIYNGSQVSFISIDNQVVTLTDSQTLTNKSGLISQWTNDAGYLTTLSGSAGGELSGTYPNPILVNSAVISKVLTGLNITGSSISSSDSILSAFGKVQNQINGLLGGAIYQGTWSAITNTPTLVDGTGTKGHYYVASDSAVVNFGSGNIDFHTGDWVIYNGSIWQKVDNTDAVTSVNGYIGAVNLTTSDISEGTNLYYTNTRGIGSVLTGYTSGSGTISSSDSILTAIQKLNGNISGLVTGVSSVGANFLLTSSGGANPQISSSMNTNRLVGRGHSGTGVFEEIVLGTGLSFTVTSSVTLNVSGVNSLAITNDVSTNATMYPTWVTANTGNLPLFVSSSKMSYNPGLGLMNLTSTSEVLRLSYDGSNYLSTTISNTGGVTNTITGTGKLFTFNADLLIGNTVKQLTIGRGTTNGDGNIVLGYLSLAASKSNAPDNIAIGDNVMNSLTIGNANIGIGTNALHSLSNGGASGNIGIGINSLNSATSSTANIGIGSNTLSSTTSDNNIAIGATSANSNTVGTKNISIGIGSLQTNVAGSNITAIGYQAMFSSNNTTTPFNMNSVAVGYQALFGAFPVPPTGVNNTGIGYSVFKNYTSGGNLTGLGYNVGQDITTGSANTFIGYNTGLGITTGNYNTILGASVTGLSSSLSNNIILADGQGNIRLQFNSSGVASFSNAFTLPNGSLATTQGALDNSTKVATTAYVDAAVLAGGGGGTGTLTGPISATLGVTSITSQTGTGTKFVVDTSPTLVTPNIGVATATSVNKLTITAPTTSSTLTVVDGSSLITSGAFSLTLLTSATTVATFPTGTNTLYSTKSASITSSQLSISLSDEVGTGFAVFNDSPVFTTNITTPLIIGGTGTTSTLIYKTTSGVGATGADHIFQVGNNGATEAMRIFNNGKVSIGTATSSSALNVLSTTEQIRSSYDASNYFSTTVNSTGSTTFNLTGTSPIFTFSQAVNVPTGSVGVTQTIGDNSTKLATTAYVDLYDQGTVWTSTSAAITGFNTATPTCTSFYRQTKNMVIMYIYINGTSNATGFTFQLPIAPNSSIVSAGIKFPGSITNNTAESPGYLSLSGGSTTASVTSAAASFTGAFTASGVKGCKFSFLYFI